MSTIWCACVGIDLFSITEADGGSIRQSNSWCYGGDGEYYRAFEAKRDAESAVIKLMQERLKFAAESMELLGAPAGMSKWISVDERMPEDEGLYLTYWSDAVIESYPLDPDTFPDFKFAPLGNTKVTHWMPLPDAPT